MDGFGRAVKWGLLTSIEPVTRTLNKPAAANVNLFLMDGTSTGVTFGVPVPNSND